MRRTAASEKGAVGAAGEEHSALPARSGFGAEAAWIGLRAPRPERSAVPGERARRAIGIAGSADRRADIHQRLGEIARSPAWRQHSRRRLDFASRSRNRLIEREEAGHDAADVAVDRRGLAPEGDRRNRRSGIGADAGEGPQLRLFARKPAAAASDFLGAGVQVSRPRIVAETRERADHSLDRGGGQILDPRPFRDERLVVGRRRLRRRLLQQHF